MGESSVILALSGATVWEQDLSLGHELYFWNPFLLGEYNSQP